MSTILTVTMSPSIDVSALTRKIVPSRKLRCAEARRDAGGGGINVARVLKRLGTDCLALYPAGGSPGDLLHSLLEAEGISSVPVAIAAETRENFTVLEQSSGEQYRFVLPGAELNRGECRVCLERIDALTRSGTWLVASGSLPPGVPHDFPAELARLARARGARMALDTSGEALAPALQEGVFLCKPNLNELRELTGLPLEHEPEWLDAAASLVETDRAEVVALTLGDKGALLVARDLRLTAPAIPVEIASAVGAGDSFLAGLVHELSCGGSIEQAFRLAAAAGTAALLTSGTELARKADIDRLYADVRVERR